MSRLRTFRLDATVTTADAGRVGAVLRDVLGRTVVARASATGLAVEASVIGVEARELTRQLVRAIRDIDAHAHVVAAWSAEGETERFRDWVRLKP